MNRDELVKFLTNASELEEQHSGVVAKFFLDDFEWDGIEEEKVERVKEILKLIGNQTMNHESMLDNLVGVIKDSDKDEF